MGTVRLKAETAGNSVWVSTYVRTEPRGSDDYHAVGGRTADGLESR